MYIYIVYIYIFVYIYCIYIVYILYIYIYCIYIVYIYMCVYIYIYMYVYVYVCICMYMYMYMCIYMCVYVYIYIESLPHKITHRQMPGIPTFYCPTVFSLTRGEVGWQSTAIRGLQTLVCYSPTTGGVTSIIAPVHHPSCVRRWFHVLYGLLTCFS